MKNRLFPLILFIFITIITGCSGGCNIGSIIGFSSGGSLDAGFGNNGIVTIGIGSVIDFPAVIAIQPDGKVVVGGYNSKDADRSFVLVRYNTDGSFDLDFGELGKVLTEIGGKKDTVNGIAIQEDGKIILAAYADSRFDRNLLLYRYSNDGFLDLEFGKEGKLIAEKAEGIDFFHAIAVQSDGKFVLRGFVDSVKSGGSPNAYPGYLVRYNPDGSIDKSFGVLGIVSLNISLTRRYIEGSNNTIAIQPDGKIIVVGDGGGNFILARYNDNGSLDITFGEEKDKFGRIIGSGGGKSTTSIGFESAVSCIAIQPDGKILAGGITKAERSSRMSDHDFVLARYNPNGSLDMGFGEYHWGGYEKRKGSGKVTTDVGSLNDDARSIVIQPDGKIVAAGYYQKGDTHNLAIVRYNSNGIYDTGYRIHLKNRENVMNAIALQPDNKIVIGGYVGSGYMSGDGHREFALLRYNTDGTIDDSFGYRGIVITNSENRENVINVIAILSDSKILAAGYTGNGNSSDITLIRYNDDGRLDTTFLGSGATVIKNPSENNINAATDMAIQPDGKIVVVGYVGYDGVEKSRTVRYRNFALLRFNPEGILDNDFGSNGMATVPISGIENIATAVAIQTDGKIIIGGSTRKAQDSASEFVLVRYNSDGSIDNSFGNQGKVIISEGVRGFISKRFSIQSDGRIVVLGQHTRLDPNEQKNPFLAPAERTISDLVITRLNSDGSLDKDFGKYGKAVTPIDKMASLNSSTFAIQPDGKIVIGGSASGKKQKFGNFAMQRYKTNGVLDNSFGKGGKVITEINNAISSINAIAIQPDGKIVAVGRYCGSGNPLITSNCDFALVRYNP
jgi:uncharacterized delta-60 repeat protein